MYAARLIMLCIGIHRDDLTSVRYIDPVYVGRELAAVAAEMFDSNTLVVLLPIHSHRNHPSLVPIDNVPGAWPTHEDVATQGKIPGIVVNHVAMFLAIKAWGLKRNENRADLLARAWMQEGGLLGR